MRTLAVAGLCLAAAGIAWAQSDAGPTRPQLVLSPPAGGAWPDPAPALDDAVAAFCRLMDTDGDGAVSPEELRPWVVEVRLAPGVDTAVGGGGSSIQFAQGATWTGTQGPLRVDAGSVQVLRGSAWTPLQGTFEVGQGTIEVREGAAWTPVTGTVHVQEGALHVLEGGTWIPVEGQVRVIGGTWTPLQDTIGAGDAARPLLPPECSDELRRVEAQPQAQGVTCGAGAGQLAFRTVCNAPGHTSLAIQLPEGRDAACFGVEATTPQTPFFRIAAEGDPERVLFDSSRDRLDDLGQVYLADPGAYRIDLDEAASAPGARVTVRFVDYPE